MFTTTFVPNPNHTPGSKVATHVSVTVCDCGESNVVKRYVDNGDATEFSCKSCKRSETF